LDLTIAILNWNGKNLLESCLPSVVSNSPSAKIAVIDNCSTDQSVEFIKDHFPRVEIIQLKSNLGFAGGYNEGLKSIDSDLLCLLNNDVEVAPGWLDPIISEFQQKDVGILQPKILDYYHRDKFEYAGAAGGFIDKYGFPFCRGRIFDTLENDSGQYDEASDIFWASGACLFIRKSVFDTVGKFDSRFFAHMEEIDLCWRARAAGHGIRCIPSSVVYHMGGATLKSQSPRKTYLNFRNSLYLLLKNLPSNQLLSVLFVRLFQDGLASVKFFLDADFRHSLAVLQSHVSFYWNIRVFLNNRIPSKEVKKYYHVKSIVWSYFVKGIKTFRGL